MLISKIGACGGMSEGFPILNRSRKMNSGRAETWSVEDERGLKLELDGFGGLMAEEHWSKRRDD